MTPAELREKARKEGWSEDFARFPDGQLQAWINESWDENAGKFRSNHTPAGQEGQPWTYVEKPSESVTDPSGVEWGPWGNKNGVNVSDAKAREASGMPGASAGGATAAPAVPAWDGIFRTSAPTAESGSSGLQQTLEQKFQDRGTMFGFKDARDSTSGVAGDLLGKSLTGGGMWWGDTEGMLKPNTPAVTPSGGGGGGGGSSAPAPAAAAAPAAAPVLPATYNNEMQKSPLQQSMEKKFKPYYGTSGIGGYGSGSYLDNIGRA